VDPWGRAARSLELVRFRTVRLILREAARRLDGADLIEVEIDNRLQGLAGGGVVERLGQRLEPLRVFALQSDEFGHGIAPALMAAAAVGGPAIADDRGAGMPGAIAGLPLGSGKRLVAFRGAWRTIPSRNVIAALQPAAASCKMGG
jgi:hypothetical protein